MRDLMVYNVWPNARFLVVPLSYPGTDWWMSSQGSVTQQCKLGHSKKGFHHHTPNNHLAYCSAKVMKMLVFSISLHYLIDTQYMSIFVNFGHVFHYKILIILSILRRMMKKLPVYFWVALTIYIVSKLWTKLTNSMTRTNSKKGPYFSPAAIIYHKGLYATTRVTL